MPQPFDSGDDLSLRHLPDVSDLSFQIPGAVQGDNLLADDDLDFFKGPNVSMAPLSPPTEPPSQLTHKPKAEKLPASEDRRKLSSFPALSYDNSEDGHTNPKQKKANLNERGKVSTSVNVLSKPKPKVATNNVAKLPLCEASPAAVRLDNLRAELNLFSDNVVAGPSTSVNHQELLYHRPTGILKKSLEKKRPQRISPRNHQKVTEGGITKTRCPTKLSPIPSYHPDTLQKQDSTTRLLPQQVKQVNEDLSFADSSLSSAAEGVAGRLVMYSQKLINSFGLLNSDRSLDANNPCEALISLDQEAGTDMEVAQGRAPFDADRPLTLSQLSPQKATNDSNPALRNTVPMSPLRLPTKRPVSAASNVLHKCKKSKTDASSAAVSVPKLSTAPKTRLRAKKRHPEPISSNSNSELRFNDRSTRRKPMSTKTDGPGIKRPPVFKPEAFELSGGGNKNKDIITTSASNSTIASTSSLKNSKKDAEPVNSVTLNNKGKNVASSSQGSSRADVPQPATRPVPFNFQSGRRGPEIRNKAKSSIDVRERSESQSEKRLHHSTTIPDFKAMHVAQEAELALRKENIHPVVSLPFQWETDHRLKERQKFDERVREKEREQERLMELRRREQEEEEERELRELRKKAVPKAHEVPEWYKEAPKKKKENAMVGSIGR